MGKQEQKKQLWRWEILSDSYNVLVFKKMIIKTNSLTGYVNPLHDS